MEAEQQIGLFLILKIYLNSGWLLEAMGRMGTL
jgi:hypothetical protein